MTSNSSSIPRSLYSLHHERACTKGGALAYSRLFGPLSRLSCPQVGQWLPLGWPALYLYFHLYLFVFVATKFGQFDLAIQSMCQAMHTNMHCIYEAYGWPAGQYNETFNAMFTLVRFTSVCICRLALWPGPHIPVIPHNCHWRHWRRQCKFFWPV